MLQVKTTKYFHFYFISMATNYTTKTAALKATKADMRQVAVSKKIEIGSTDTKTIIQDGEVSADDLLIGVDVKNEETGETTRERQSVKTLIKNAADSAAIKVGRDADKNWSVDETAIDMVKKISFLGDYVNVVPGENGEVKLYIGENKSLEEADRSALSVSLPSTENLVLYTDDTDDFSLKSGVSANGSATAVVCKTADAGFGSTKFTANGGSFTTDQTDCIWVRTTYNYGTPSAWGKVQLNKNRGTYNRNTTTPTASTVTVAAVTDVTLPAGVTMNVGNYILTAEADAQYGKVPGRCETAYDFTVDWNTIATKGGGNIKVEWGLGTANEAGDAPSSAVNIVSYERFFTEKKSVSMEANTFTAVIKDAATSDAVSGITYNTSGTTATINTGNISNSQYKTASSTKRLAVDAAGTAHNYTNAELTLVSGTITKSDAVYKATDKVVTLGSTGNVGTATITATPYGNGSGTAQSKTIVSFWGDVTKNSDGTASSATTEVWAKETYRALNIDGTGTWDATADVTGVSLTVNGESTQGAVAQYGSLKHPADAKKDGTNKDYPSADTTVAASYVRKFSGIGATSGFKVTGSNFKTSGVKVYWYEASNGKLVQLNDTNNPKNTVTATEIKHEYNLATESATTSPVIIFVIPQGVTMSKVTVSAL